MVRHSTRGAGLVGKLVLGAVAALGLSSCESSGTMMLNGASLGTGAYALKPGLNPNRAARAAFASNQLGNLANQSAMMDAAQANRSETNVYVNTQGQQVQQVQQVVVRQVTKKVVPLDYILGLYVMTDKGWVKPDDIRKSLTGNVYDYRDQWVLTGHNDDPNPNSNPLTAIEKAVCRTPNLREKYSIECPIKNSEEVYGTLISDVTPREITNRAIANSAKLKIIDNIPYYLPEDGGDETKKDEMKIFNGRAVYPHKPWSQEPPKPKVKIPLGKLLSFYWNDDGDDGGRWFKPDDIRKSLTGDFYIIQLLFVKIGRYEDPVPTPQKKGSFTCLSPDERNYLSIDLPVADWENLNMPQPKTH